MLVHYWYRLYTLLLPVCICIACLLEFIHTFMEFWKVLCNEVVSIVVQGSPTDAGASSDSSGSLVLQQSFHFVGQVSCMPITSTMHICLHIVVVYGVHLSVCVPFIILTKQNVIKYFPGGLVRVPSTV